MRKLVLGVILACSSLLLSPSYAQDFDTIAAPLNGEYPLKMKCRAAPLKCLKMERDYWDTMLNDSYKGVMNYCENSASPQECKNSIKHMQRAWIKYRDGVRSLSDVKGLDRIKFEELKLQREIDLLKNQITLLRYSLDV